MRNAPFAALLTLPPAQIILYPENRPEENNPNASIVSGAKHPRANYKRGAG